MCAPSPVLQNDLILFAGPPMVRGGVFDQTSEVETPFGFGKGEGFDRGSDETEWIVSRDRYRADEQFESLNPIDGKLNGW
jgi:hypothetical protein